MSLSMYQASVPVFVKTLINLSKILAKGDAHATARKVDPTVLLQTCLFPDMFPLVRQVQIAADGAKGGAGRLAGIEIPKFEDKETTFAELQDRLVRTIKFIESVRADQIDGSEDKDIVLPIGKDEMRFKGQGYLLDFVLPNMFFHATTTYAILRHCGVEVGKGDFLGLR